jgi:hypothetical protein
MPYFLFYRGTADLPESLPSALSEQAAWDLAAKGREIWREKLEIACDVVNVCSSSFAHIHLMLTSHSEVASALQCNRAGFFSVAGCKQLGEMQTRGKCPSVASGHIKSSVG